MFEETNPERRASRREIRLLKLLRSMLPPYPHWARRAREIERRLLRGRLGALPAPPRRKIGAGEWETRMAALAEIPTCVDRAELGLSPDGRTKCARTGLVLERGRCGDCPCKR